MEFANNSGRVWKRVGRFLLKKDAAPYWLQMPLVFCEFVSLLCLLDMEHLAVLRQITLPLTGDQFLLPLMLGLMLLLQLTCNVSLVRGVYIIALDAALNLLSAEVAIVVAVLLFLLLIADCISTCQFSFYSMNVFSERFNSIKVLHYSCVVLAAFVIRVDFVTGPSKCIANGCIFFSLFIVRSLCYMNNSFLRMTFEVEYLASSILSFALLLRLQFIEVLYISVFWLVILIEFSKELVVRRITNQIKKPTDRDTPVELFDIARSIFSSKYTKKTPPQVARWSNVNPALQNSVLSICAKDQFMEELYNYASGVCACTQSFEALLLRAQIEFKIRKNVFEAIRLLREIMCRLSCLSVIKRILVRKVESDIHQYILYRFKGYKASEFEEYIENVGFADVLLAGSKVYETIWQNRTESELVMDQVERNLFKAVALNKRIAKRYSKMQYRNRDSIFSYAVYAYWVMRDCSLSNSLIKEYLFYIHERLRVANTSIVMLQISLERSSIGHVLNCTTNVRGKLGFSKKELLESDIGMLVPSFYQNFHANAIERMLDSTTDKSEVFDLKKHSVCSNSEGELIEFKGRFRVLPILEKLSVIGYVQLPQRKYRDYWLAVDKATAQLVNCGPPFYVHHADQNPKLHDILIAPENQDPIGVLFQERSLRVTYSMETLSLQLDMHLFKEVACGDRTIMLLKTMSDSNAEDEADNMKTDFHKIVTTKHLVASDSSIATFFEQKEKLLAASKKGISFELGLLLALCLLFVIGTALLFRGSGAWTATNGSLASNSRSMIRRNQLLSMMFKHMRFMKIMYNLNVSYPAVDYNDLQKQQSYLTEIVRLNQDLRNVSDGDEKVEEAISNKTSYQIGSFQLVESAVSSMSSIYSFIKTRSITPSAMKILRSQLDYLNKNEETIISTVLDAQMKGLGADFPLNTGEIWGLVAATMLLVMLLGVTLVYAERKSAYRDNKLCVLFWSINNEDRLKLSLSVVSFMESMLVVNAQDIDSNLIASNLLNKTNSEFDNRTIGTNGSGLLFGQSSLRSPKHSLAQNDAVSNVSFTGLQSPVANHTIGSASMRFAHLSINGSLLEQRSGQSSSRQLFNVPSTSRRAAADYNNGSSRSGPAAAAIRPKVRRINVLFVVVVVLMCSGVLAVQAMSLANTFSKRFRIATTYMNSMLLCFSQPIDFCKLESFFLRSIESGFAENHNFDSQAAKWMVSDKESMTFDTEIMQLPQFSSFNELYRKIKYSNVCDFNDCGPYANGIGATLLQTCKLKFVDYMSSVVREYQNQPNANIVAVLREPTMSETVFLSELNDALTTQLLGLMTNGLFELIAVVSVEQERFYWITIFSLLGEIAMLVAPLGVFVYRRWVRNREALDLLKRDNYIVTESRT